MKFTFSIVFFLIISTMSAQEIADFENINIAQDSFLNGSDRNGGFNSGSVFLANAYDTTFNSWSGWAISNQSNTTTPGFMNQYSAITGMGVDSSSNYAVSFTFGANIIQMKNELAGMPVKGIFVTNSTFAYLSIKDGDSFAKKFGGLTGDDPDFFLLTIKSYYNGVLSADSVDFYLADYRFTDNSMDYLIDQWTFVDLSSLGNVDSLALTLSSSDVGQFGMNTPAYFCVDNIGADNVTGLFSAKQTLLPFSIFPNPASDYIMLENVEPQKLQVAIYSLDGKLLYQKDKLDAEERIALGFLASGSYLLRIWEEKSSGTQLFIKR